MTQTTTLKRNMTAVGEEISHDLGAKMVKDFQDTYPNHGTGNYIGRDILERILNQPGCVGINFYNAINEDGRNTLVYVGVDENQQLITKLTSIDISGQLVVEKGIVADRLVNPMDNGDIEWFT